VKPGVTTGYYQIGDVNDHLVSSVGVFTDAATCAAWGTFTFTSPSLCCHGRSPFNLSAAEVATFDARFGLIPPFQVVGP
jgi:hypothetical protein